eukprot:254662-Pelagomonas_calceolata.AAC.9
MAFPELTIRGWLASNTHRPAVSLGAPIHPPHSAGAWCGSTQWPWARPGHYATIKNVQHCCKAINFAGAWCGSTHWPWARPAHYTTIKNVLHCDEGRKAINSAGARCGLAWFVAMRVARPSTMQGRGVATLNGLGLALPITPQSRMCNIARPSCLQGRGVTRHTSLKLALLIMP